MKPESPEQFEFAALLVFWFRYNDDPDPAARLALLKRYSWVRVNGRSVGWYRAQRAAARQAPAAASSLNTCWSCGGTNGHLVRHHIIQVQKGGSDSPRNRIEICDECHAAIHPWLRTFGRRATDRLVGNNNGR